MSSPRSLEDRFDSLFGSLAAIGRGPNGHTRLTYSAEDAAARDWFRATADRLGLVTRSDGNGNLFAWWGDPDAEQVVLTGSHLDTVVEGGAFDGALGIVSAFLAIEDLQVSHSPPDTAIGIVSFAEEEGARFGAATLGSRLLTGTVAPEDALGLVDHDGVSLADAMAAMGHSPDDAGPDPDLLARTRAFVELHVEQGRGLAHHNVPVGGISGVWPHGRWHLALEGEPDHAGTTALEDRSDPALVLAAAIAAARSAGHAAGARATIGRIEVRPNTTNTIAAEINARLDARAPDDDALAAAVARVDRAVADAASEHRVSASVTIESSSDGVDFDEALGGVIRDALAAHGIEPTSIPTGAGHDAAILSSHVPSAMLHVRNPTGASHTPKEGADAVDCVAGVRVLTDVLERLVFS